MRNQITQVERCRYCYREIVRENERDVWHTRDGFILCRPAVDVSLDFDKQQHVPGAPMVSVFA